MRLVLVNPNADVAMSRRIAAVARASAPAAQVRVLTNSAGPAVIEGAADGARALPGMLALLHGERFDAAIVACFDDVGLAEARDERAGPVFGLGSAACHLAAAAGRFAVVTTVPAAVPIILANLAAAGLSGACSGVIAAGVPVRALEHDRDAATRAVIATAAACAAPGVVLGCAGMTGLGPAVAAATGRRVVDPVRAAVLAAVATALPVSANPALTAEPTGRTVR